MDLATLIAALALVFLNGFFVAAEFALVKVRPSKIQELIDNQRPGARAVKDVVANLEGYVSATQLGVTFSSLGLGWLGGPSFTAGLRPVLGHSASRSRTMSRLSASFSLLRQSPFFT